MKILSSDNRSHLGCLKLLNGIYIKNMLESLNYLIQIHFLRFEKVTESYPGQTEVQGLL